MSCGFLSKSDHVNIGLLILGLRTGKYLYFRCGYYGFGAHNLRHALQQPTKRDAYKYLWLFIK